MQTGGQAGRPAGGRVLVRAEDGWAGREEGVCVVGWDLSAVGTVTGTTKAEATALSHAQKGRMLRPPHSVGALNELLMNQLLLLLLLLLAKSFQNDRWARPQEDRPKESGGKETRTETKRERRQRDDT